MNINQDIENMSNLVFKQAGLLDHSGVLDQLMPARKEMRQLADELRQLLGVEYVGHVTDTQLRIGRESLEEMIAVIKGMKQ